VKRRRFPTRTLSETSLLKRRCSRDRRFKSSKVQGWRFRKKCHSNVISSGTRNPVGSTHLKDCISPGVYPELVEGVDMTHEKVLIFCEGIKMKCKVKL
jgi:hypothetical protein